MSNKSMIKNVNQHTFALPGCPLCGSLTTLDEITIHVGASGGGGFLRAYVLSCLMSVRANAADRGVPPCTFSVPMDWTQPRS